MRVIREILEVIVERWLFLLMLGFLFTGISSDDLTLTLALLIAVASCSAIFATCWRVRRTW